MPRTLWNICRILHQIFASNPTLNWLTYYSFHILNSIPSYSIFKTNRITNKMESLCLFICFVTVIAALNYEETAWDDLIDNDIVRIHYVLRHTYLRDDDGTTAGGTISASATLANSDYFLWNVGTIQINNNYYKTFQNIASGRYLKTRTNGNSCMTGPISTWSTGAAAAWSKESNTKFKNYKNSACCSVESSDDSDIQWDTTCNNLNQNVEFEKKVPNVYFAVNNPQTADSAATSCEALGATLATITSEEDNDEVHSLCASTSTGVCWIGLNDITTEDTPQWRDGTTYSYTNLIATTNSDTLDCVVIISDKTWGYQKCINSNPFICMGTTIIC
eukprot:111352_1